MVYNVSGTEPSSHLGSRFLSVLLPRLRLTGLRSWRISSFGFNLPITFVRFRATVAFMGVHEGREGTRRFYFRPSSHFLELKRSCALMSGTKDKRGTLGNTTASTLPCFARQWNLYVRICGHVIVFCSVVPIRSRSPLCGCRSLME